jgi:hypothetical protein
VFLTKSDGGASFGWRFSRVGVRNQNMIVDCSLLL